MSNLPNLPPHSQKPSSTEVIPIWSAKISVLQSGLLLPGAVTILVSQLELAGPTPPALMRDFWRHAANA